ncbi:MAG TPA: pteridine-dependent deoxygenase like protein [Thermoanaerobaculia bacterium]
MSELSYVVSVSSSLPGADERGLLPPSWVGSLLGRSARQGFSFASVRIRDARGLDRAALREATADAYRRIRDELHGRAPHPVRLWNHIPGIHEPMGDGQDRYRVFNAGRFEALSEWLGGQESFDTRVASASGIGHDGRDLVIHCLAADRPGQAVANPRQTAPYRYSHKYGPLPPCFARATVIRPPDDQPLALVGGTASIVGEESVHLGDLARQTDETLANLAVLLLAAAGEPAMEATDRAAVLARYRDVRVYYPDPERLDELRLLLKDAFPRAGQVEWVPAGLCRPELLIEIEGVAELRR